MTVTTASSPGIVAVTGASGQLGGAVLRHLAERGLRVRALARDPARVSLPAGAPVEVRRADFAEPDSVVAALDGAYTALLVSVEGADDARLALHRNAVTAAARAGVRRIAYTSFIDVAPGSPFTAAAVHRATEQAALDTGLPCLFLRSGPYIDNMVRRVARAAHDDGVYRTSAPLALLPFIARADVALACAAALAQAGDGTVVHTLTGPELLSFTDLAGLVGRLLGRPLRCEALDDAAYAADLRRLGFEEAMVRRGASYAQAMREGWLSTLTPDVERLTGRPARRMAEVLPALGLETR